MSVACSCPIECLSDFVSEKVGADGLHVTWRFSQRPGAVLVAKAHPYRACSPIQRNVRVENALQADERFISSFDQRGCLSCGAQQQDDCCSCKVIPRHAVRRCKFTGECSDEQRTRDQGPDGDSASCFLCFTTEKFAIVSYSPENGHNRGQPTKGSAQTWLPEVGDIMIYTGAAIQAPELRRRKRGNPMKLNLEIQAGPA